MTSDGLNPVPMREPLPYWLNAAAVGVIITHWGLRSHLSTLNLSSSNIRVDSSRGNLNHLISRHFPGAGFEMKAGGDAWPLIS